MRALIVGASAGVGRALSEVLAARGDSLLLVASDARDLEAQAAHLRLVYGVPVQIVAADASCPEQCLRQIESAVALFGLPEGLFFPIGVSRPDDRGMLGVAEAQKLVNANLVIVMAIVGSFIGGMLTTGKGYVIGFGSIAAARGRRSNIVYSAAKRGLQSYFESLRHLAAPTGVRVHLYRLGYVETQQSFGQRLLFPSISAEQVAQTVIDGLEKDRGMTSLPWYWSVITTVVSALPWRIFKRLEF